MWVVGSGMSLCFVAQSWPSILEKKSLQIAVFANELVAGRTNRTGHSDSSLPGLGDRDASKGSISRSASLAPKRQGERETVRVRRLAPPRGLHKSRWLRSTSAIALRQSLPGLLRAPREMRRDLGAFGVRARAREGVPESAASVHPGLRGWSGGRPRKGGRGWTGNLVRPPRAAEAPSRLSEARRSSRAGGGQATRPSRRSEP
jgi:hypothetical protein